MKVLIVEDEPGLQFGLLDLLQEAGYDCRVCGEGKAAMDQTAAWQPDMVILDLGLPDMDGTLVLQHLHQHRAKLPVLILTARANEADIVLGFKLGAYDYVTKPYSPRVLLARLEALVRRTEQSPGQVVLGRIQIDFERYEAQRDGHPVRLTTREIDILRVLIQNEGKPVSRNDLLDEVWGMDSEAGPRTVDTHIAILRKKIEPNPEKPSLIQSQRGIGYKLIRPRES